jgi:hypothetical protein
MKRPVERPGVFLCAVNPICRRFELATHAAIPVTAGRLISAGKQTANKNAGGCPPAPMPALFRKDPAGSALWAVVETDLVDQFGRSLSVLGYFLDRQRIRLDLAKALDRVGHLRAR